MAQYTYDVAISFAGEQRKEAEAIANCLRQNKLNVFFDDYEVFDFWGKNLPDHFTDVYQNKAEYCIILCSKDYVRKAFPTHERQVAQARALQDKGKDYILPVQFDDTPLPGMSTVGYLDYKTYGPEGICRVFLKKTGRVVADATPLPKEAPRRSNRLRYVWLTIVSLLIVTTIIVYGGLKKEKNASQAPMNSPTPEQQVQPASTPAVDVPNQHPQGTGDKSPKNKPAQKADPNTHPGVRPEPPQAEPAQGSSSASSDGTPAKPEMSGKTAQAEFPPLTAIPEDDRTPAQHSLASMGLTSQAENAAHSWFEKKHYEYALNNMNRVFAQSNPSVRDYNNRGAIYAAMKQYPQAIQDFRHAGAGGNLAKVYFMMGDYQTTLKILDELITREPGDFVAYRWRGDVKKILHDLNGATKDYKLAEEILGSPISTMGSITNPEFTWQQ